MNTIEKIKASIEPVIIDNDYILYDLSYIKENGVNSLVVVIDKKGLLTLDDCVTVSNLISPIMDSLDLIEESYVLDVCTRERGDKGE